MPDKNPAGLPGVFYLQLTMKLKTFQRQDLARAALHDGLILSWDTGLGKTWAIFLWLLLKVGHQQENIGAGRWQQGYLKPTKPQLRSPNSTLLKPAQPVLIVAPGDLHQQIVDEAWEHFGIAIFPLDSQATFGRLTRSRHSALSNLDELGRPIVPPDFYITTYTQLTTNGVERLPDPLDWPDPVSLRQWLCLMDGEPVGTDSVAEFALKHGLRHLTWDGSPLFSMELELGQAQLAGGEVKHGDEMRCGTIATRLAFGGAEDTI